VRRNVFCRPPAAGRGRSKPADTQRTKIAEFGISNVAQAPRLGRYFTHARLAREIDAISERVNVQPFE
jgi:hypothetical protein